MFVAIGADPRSELVKGQVDTDASGMCWLHTPALRQTFLGCSLLVTWWMTTISRPSPPQARVARAAIDAQHYLVS